MRKQYSQQRRRFQHETGFTLTEVMISVVIVMVLATGAVGYQYNSARDVKISEVQATASRITMELLERWNGLQGDLAFDATGVLGTDIIIETSVEGPVVPSNSSGFPLTELGRYEITAGAVTYYVTLAYEDASATEPMLLHATVAWRRNYQPGILLGNEQSVQYSTFLGYH